MNENDWLATAILTLMVVLVALLLPGCASPEADLWKNLKTYEEMQGR